MATTVAEIHRIEKKEADKGVHEDPPGSNHIKYAVAFGLDRQPYCSMFQYWCFLRGAKPEGNRVLYPRTAFTPTAAQYFINLGRWGHEPRVGALVFYNFPDSLDRIQHVGLVLAFDAATITTVEGNTSSGDAGSQDNGGGVYVRRRPRDGSIVGYAYPAYDGVEGAKPKKPIKRPRARADLRKGDSGADVLTWKRHLLKWSKTTKGKKANIPSLQGDIDSFGEHTWQATRIFQQTYKLKVDGIAGPKTIGKMEQLLRPKRKAA